MQRTPVIERNPRLTGFVGLDGATQYGIQDMFKGAPDARAAGRPTSLAAVYRSDPASLPLCAGPMTGYADWLPYLRFPSLGEGGTPLDPVPGVAASNGLGAVLLKRDAANPTG